MSLNGVLYTASVFDPIALGSVSGKQCLTWRTEATGCAIGKSIQGNVIDAPFSALADPVRLQSIPYFRAVSVGQAVVTPVVTGDVTWQWGKFPIEYDNRGCGGCVDRADRPRWRDTGKTLRGCTHFGGVLDVRKIITRQSLAFNTSALCQPCNGVVASVRYTPVVSGSSFSKGSAVAVLRNVVTSRQSGGTRAYAGVMPIGLMKQTTAMAVLYQQRAYDPVISLRGKSWLVVSVKNINSPIKRVELNTKLVKRAWLGKRVLLINKGEVEPFELTVHLINGKQVKMRMVFND